MAIIRIATRKSPLALQQSQSIAEKIKIIDPKIAVKLIPMTTTGDRFQKTKLSKIGTKGLFVKELEEALLDKRADIAVHSMKDVPTAFPEGLILAAIGERANPYDAFIGRSGCKLQALPSGALIGTCSLRRQAQLLRCRPDLKVQEIRGNVDSRLAKMNAGEFDAIILAVAGLQRLNFENEITEIFNDEEMLPSSGQGALGIECRAHDSEVQSLLSKLHHPLSGLCVHAERHVTALLGGNCHAPLAVYCKPIDNQCVRMSARVFTPNGQVMIEEKLEGAQEAAMSLAMECATRLLQRGAAEIIKGTN